VFAGAIVTKVYTESQVRGELKSNRPRNERVSIRNDEKDS
jgi:hypothetical protein